jgi:hypothetical protein
MCCYRPTATTILLENHISPSTVETVQNPNPRFEHPGQAQRRFCPPTTQMSGSALSARVWVCYVSLFRPCAELIFIPSAERRARDEGDVPRTL